MEYSSIRKNGVIGILQDNGQSLHASEWWSGEGLDFLFEGSSKRKNQNISLHMDELENLIALAHAMGFVDLDAVKEKSAAIEDQFVRDHPDKKHFEVF